MKCRVSYFSGVEVAVPGHHVEGAVRLVRHSAPPPCLRSISQGWCEPASKAATGARKSRGLARPLLPIGPSSGRRNGAPWFSQT
jgi:hypothetical protein